MRIVSQRHRKSRSTRAFVVLIGLGTTALPPLLRAGEPSPAYRESLRRTAELRRARRAAASPSAAVGRIDGYAMPPALIIRQTRERHDEIGALLDLLRYGGR